MAKTLAEYEAKIAANTTQFNNAIEASQKKVDELITAIDKLGGKTVKVNINADDVMKVMSQSLENASLWKNTKEVYQHKQKLAASLNKSKIAKLMGDAADKAKKEAKGSAEGAAAGIKGQGKDVGEAVEKFVDDESLYEEVAKVMNKVIGELNPAVHAYREAIKKYGEKGPDPRLKVKINSSRKNYSSLIVKELIKAGQVTKREELPGPVLDFLQYFEEEADLDAKDFEDLINEQDIGELIGTIKSNKADEVKHGIRDWKNGARKRGRKKGTSSLNPKNQEEGGLDEFFKIGEHYGGFKLRAPTPHELFKAEEYSNTEKWGGSKFRAPTDAEMSRLYNIMTTELPQEYLDIMGDSGVNIAPMIRAKKDMSRYGWQTEYGTTNVMGDPNKVAPISLIAMDHNMRGSVWKHELIHAGNDLIFGDNSRKGFLSAQEVGKVMAAQKLPYPRHALAYPNSMNPATKMPGRLAIDELMATIGGNYTRGEDLEDFALNIQNDIGMEAKPWASMIAKYPMLKDVKSVGPSPEEATKFATMFNSILGRVQTVRNAAFGKPQLTNTMKLIDRVRMGRGGMSHFKSMNAGKSSEEIDKMFRLVQSQQNPLYSILGTPFNTDNYRFDSAVMKEHLRAGTEMPDYAKGTMESMDELIGMNQLPFDMTLYRGERDVGHLWKNRAEIMSKPYSNKHFTSTSMDYDTAMGYTIPESSGKLWGNRNSALWRILAPKGSHGAAIKSAYDTQVVLGRDQPMSILGMSRAPRVDPNSKYTGPSSAFRGFFIDAILGGKGGMSEFGRLKGAPMFAPGDKRNREALMREFNKGNANEQYQQDFARALYKPGKSDISQVAKNFATLPNSMKAMLDKESLQFNLSMTDKVGAIDENYGAFNRNAWGRQDLVLGNQSGRTVLQHELMHALGPTMINAFGQKKLAEKLKDVPTFLHSLDAQGNRKGSKGEYKRLEETLAIIGAHYDEGDTVSALAEKLYTSKDENLAVREKGGSTRRMTEEEAYGYANTFTDVWHEAKQKRGITDNEIASYSMVDASKQFSENVIRSGETLGEKIRNFISGGGSSSGSSASINRWDATYMKWTGMAMMGAGIGSMMGMYEVVKEGSKYIKQRNLMRGLVAGTESNLYSANTNRTIQILDELVLGKEIGMTTSSTEDVAKATQLMYKMGTPDQYLKGNMVTANQFAMYSGENIVEVVNTAMSALRQFNLPASEFTNVVNAMTSATMNSSLSFDELDHNLGMAAEMAEAVGWDLNESLAAMMAMSNAGIPQERIGTSLRGLADTFGSIYMNPDLMMYNRQFGLNILDSDWNVNDLGTIADSYLNAYNRYGGEDATGIQKVMQQKMLFGSLGSRQDITAMMALLKGTQITEEGGWTDTATGKHYAQGETVQAGSMLRYNESKLEPAKGGEASSSEMMYGQATQDLGTKFDSLVFDFQAFASEWTDGSLGKQFSSIYENIREYIPALDTITNNDAATQALVDGALALTAAGATLTTAGLLLQAYAVTGLIDKATGGLMGDVIGGGLGSIFGRLFGRKGVGGAMKYGPMMGEAEAFSGFLLPEEAAAGTAGGLGLGGLLAGAAGGLVLGGAGAWALNKLGVMGEVGKAGASLSNNNLAKASIMGIPGVMPMAMLGQAVNDLVTGRWDKILEDESALIAGWTDSTKKLGDDLFGGVPKLIGDAVGAVGDAIKAAWDKSFSLGKSFGDWMRGWANVNTILNILKKPFEEAWKGLQDMPFVKFLSDLFNPQNLLTAWEGLKSSDLTDKVYGFIQGGIDGVIALLGETPFGKVLRWAFDITGFQLPSFDSVKNAATTGITGVLNNIKAAFTSGSLIKSIETFFKSITTTIETWIAPIKSKLGIFDELWYRLNHNGSLEGYTPGGAGGEYTGGAGAGGVVKPSLDLKTALSMAQGIDPGLASISYPMLIGFKTGHDIGMPGMTEMYDMYTGMIKNSLGQSYTYSFAKGGIISSPVNAVVGDSPMGPELVAPLSKLPEMLEPYMPKGSVESSGGNVIIVVELDGREIGRTSAPYTAEYIRLKAGLRA